MSSWSRFSRSSSSVSSGSSPAIAPTIAAGSAASAHGLGDRELQPFERDADAVRHHGWSTPLATARKSPHRLKTRSASWSGRPVVTRTTVSQSRFLASSVIGLCLAGASRSGPA